MKTKKSATSTKTTKTKKAAQANVDPLQNAAGYREHANTLAAKADERAEFESCAQAAAENFDDETARAATQVDAEIVKAAAGKTPAAPKTTTKTASKPGATVLAAPVQAALDELRASIGAKAADSVFQHVLRGLGARTVVDGKVGPFCIKLAGKFAAETLVEGLRKQAEIQAAQVAAKAAATPAPVAGVN
jgi:hypothetical protein